VDARDAAERGEGGRMRRDYLTREDEYPAINISRIRIGGDLGGLIFVVGMEVCFLIGVPAARDFLAASLAGGVIVAIGLGSWHRHRSRLAGR
jgi:hypothetical protein